jgi:hypothetical protein
LSKNQFPGIFRQTWFKVANFENACHAFRQSGLFTLTPNGIDKTKLGPSKMVVREIVPQENQTANNERESNVPSTSSSENTVNDTSSSEKENCNKHVHLSQSEIAKTTLCLAATCSVGTLLSQSIASVSVLSVSCT